MKKITLLLLLTVSVSFSQMKIDSLGYHLGEDGYFIIKVKDKSASEIYSKLLDYVNKNFKNPDEVILAKTKDSYLRMEFIDYSMGIHKRSLTTMNVGGKTNLEFDIKEGKIRIKEFVPEIYMNADDVTNRLSFQITGGMLTNSFYNKKLKPKKEYLKSGLKNQIENYYNDLFKTIGSFLNGESKKDDW
jgi:hypothetical protein